MIRRPPRSTLDRSHSFPTRRSSDLTKSAEMLYCKAIKLADIKNKGAANNNYGTFLFRQKRYNEALKYFLLAANDPNYINFVFAKSNIKKTQNKIQPKK